MKINPFGVEQWMNEWEEKCQYNLAETCVESLTIRELLEFTGNQDKILQNMLDMQMNYESITGSTRLRELIAEQYSNQNEDNVLVTHGAIGANALIYETLLEPSDTMISVLPTYQQHYSIPEQYGAHVKILHLREENNFLPVVDELKLLIDNKTKIIAINNPNNPTGSLMERILLEEIVEVARSVNAWILSDEVYRGTNQDGELYTVSIADIYEKGLSVGSMSKTYSLAGLRLGWIVGPSFVLKEIETHRDYNTISVGRLDDYFATIALENREKILERSKRILTKNLEILDDWVNNEPLISYVKPRSATVALLKYNLPISSKDFCLSLLNKYGVMLVPGEVMEMDGYLRVGFTNNSESLKTGLSLVTKFLEESSVGYQS